MPLLLLAGAALGVLSRIDETSDAIAFVSTHVTWVLAAFLARGAVRGAALLTVANVAYYAWIATTEPGTPLTVAGSVEHWFVTGVAAGALFGYLGARRRAWTLPLVAVVLIADAANVLDPVLP